MPEHRDVIDAVEMHVVVVAGDSGVDLSSNTVGGQGQSGEAIKLFQAPRKISFF